MNFLKKYAGIPLLLILIAGAYAFPMQKVSTPRLGGTFTPVQAQRFTLSGAGTTATASSIVVNNLVLPDGVTPLSMSMFGSIGYATIEAGTNKEENISFTGITQNTNNTATLTGASRGLAFTAPYAASTTLAYAHAGGTYLILSNSAAFYSQFGVLGNAQTWGGVNTYASTSQPVYDGAPTFTNGLSLIDKTYADGLVIAGGVAGSNTVPGILMTATGLQAASSTASGTYNAQSYLRVLPAGIATDTPNTATRGSVVLMSQIGGFLNQAWLDFSKLFTFTGGLTSTATTTLAGSNVNSNALVINGLAYKFPSALTASSTYLSIDALGNMSWEQPTAGSYVGTAQATSSSAAAGSTQDYTYVTTFAPTTITLYYNLIGYVASTAHYTNGSCTYTGTSAIGGQYTASDAVAATAASGGGNGCALIAGNGLASNNGYSIAIQSVTSTGFTVRVTFVTGSNANTASASFYPIAYR